VSPDADVNAIYAAALAAEPDAMGQVLSGTDGNFAAAQFTVQTSAGEEGAAELRAALVDDFAPVTDAGLDVISTSQEIISAVIIESLSDSQVRSLFITLAAAMLLLMINFWFESRRPFLGVITILPVALVVLWTFGMMAATGIPFNPVTATLSALAIGIGVPFTIHVTHRFQEDRIRFEEPEEAIRSTARHTGGALAGSAFTTMAGFGVLITSSLKPFAQMGQVTVYAIGFALVASVLVLPSMLALWDAWHRRRGDAVLDRSALEATELIGE
jgi:predicted RND superfamily exporter protein